MFNSESSDSIIAIVKGDDQIIHAWEIRSNFVIKTDNVVANANYTVASPALLEEVIGVGAYTTKKVGWYDYSIIDDIAPFSSRGPTLDGRIKPDITAPGSEIFSAQSIFLEYNPYYVDHIVYSNHGIVAASGTSMSSPMVAGIVALMLGKKPNLTQQEAKQIIRITATNDQWTGNAKNNKNTTWGWGKINAHEIMLYLEKTSINDELNMDLYIFPNPTTDYINIIFDNPTSGNVRIDLVDVMGQIIGTHLDRYCDAGIQAISINDLDLLSGAYFLRMTTNKTSQVKSFIVK